MPLSIPNKPEELTAPWLSDALHEGGLLLNGKIDRVAIEPLDSSRSVYGTLVRLHLEYSSGSPQLPGTMVAKLPSSSPKAADALRAFGGGRTEVSFYQQIGESIGLRIPGCYFSLYDEATGRFVLLLEDLSAHRSLSPQDDLTEQEIVAVVTSLAVSHASWWQSPRLAGLDWLRSWGDSARHQRFLAAWPVIVDHLGGRSSKLAALGPHIISIVAQGEETLASPPLTLLHMDVRQENLFYEGTEANPVPIFIDWQNVRCGRGASGLGSFLAFLPQRDRLEDTMLRIYHSELVRGGAHGYPFEQCVQDYRMGVLRRLTGPIAVLASVGADNVQGSAVLDLVSRFGLANLERYL